MLAIYCRVSSDSQEQAGTIEYQISAGRAWAESKTFTDYRLYRDDGISASDDLSKQHGILQLLEDIKKGAVDSLWIMALDRLSRNVSTYAVVLNELKRHHVKLYIKNDELDLLNPTDAFLTNILASVAEFEKEMIKVRTALGRRKVKDAGLYNKSSLYGYKKVGRDEATGRIIIAPDHEELNKMKMIFEKMLEGKTLHYIAKKILKLDNSGSWVTRVRMPEYAGYTRNGNGELIPSPLYKPIITLKDWKKVQDLYEASASKVKTNMRKANHLGSGLLECFYCGRKFYITYTTKPSGKVYPYYRQNRLMLTHCAHPSNQISKAKLDEIIDFAYLFHFSNRTVFQTEINAARDRLLEQDSEADTSIKQTEIEIAKESKKETRILKAILDGMDSKMFKDEARRIKEALESLREKLSKLKEEKRSKFDDFEGTSKAAILKNIEEYRGFDEHDKREQFRKVLKKAIIKDEVIVFSMRNNKHYIFSREGLYIKEQVLMTELPLKEHRLVPDGNKIRMLVETKLGKGRSPAVVNLDFAPTPYSDLMANDCILLDKLIDENDPFPLTIWDFR